MKLCSLEFVLLLFGLFLIYGNNDEASAQKTSLQVSMDHAPSLMKLLEASRSAERAQALDAQIIHEVNFSMDDSSPIWPLHIFLAAEIHRLRGDEDTARDTYRLLAEWAASDPYGDGWGGSGLASLALWRWLRQTNEALSLDKNESLQLIEVAERLLNTRLIKGMFQHHTQLLSSLPQLEEDIRRRLAKLAWKSGDRDKANRLFLNYLEITRTPDLDEIEKEIRKNLIDSGLATYDRLELFRGTRLESLGMYEKAFKLLKQVHTQTENLQVRAEAGLHLANIERILDESKKVAKRAEVAELLGSVLEDTTDPDIAQRALFDRAILFNREGTGQNRKQTRKDLERLVKEFPDGQLADDALFELARYHQNSGDVENALVYFKKVQSFDGENDWLNTSYFQPAITLYRRGRPSDIEQAMAFLVELVEEKPFGPLYLNALFWLGRMASEKGDKQRAERYFRQIIDTSPWDYYAIRARMHLNLDDAARKEYMPGFATRREIQAIYQSSKIDRSFSGSSAFHHRLAFSVNSGLYSQVLSAERELVKHFISRRLENIPIHELEEAGLLTRMGLLLALRQDSLAAADLDDAPVNRLSIGGTIGAGAQDWPLSFSIVHASGKSNFEKAALQRDQRYLATAYPEVGFVAQFQKAAKKYRLKPEILYSVSRRESFFYPSALSTRGALGLFQFIPTTFDNLNQDWNLLNKAQLSSREAYLLQTKLNINLWARWFRQRLLKRYDDNFFYAILDHNSGITAVRGWIKGWEAVDRADDVEYMVETCRYLQSRIFIRGVLTDMAIIEAAGIFKSE